MCAHLDRGQRFGQRADLVDLDQDRIGDAVFDAVGQPRHVGDENIVADELAFLADFLRQHLPARGIVLGHAVFDRHDRIALGQFGEIIDLLLDRAGLALAFVLIGAVVEEFARRRIERQHDIFAGAVAGLLDRRQDEIERGLGRRQVGRKAALVADIGIVAGGFERRAQGVKDLRRRRARLRRKTARRAARS